MDCLMCMHKWAAQLSELAKAKVKKMKLEERHARGRKVYYVLSLIGCTFETLKTTF